MIFKRKKDDDTGALAPSEAEVLADAVVEDEVEQDEAAAVAEAVVDEVAEFDRSQGPFDVTEAPEDQGEEQLIDLGAVRIPLVEDLEIRIEVDEGSGQPVAVTLISGQGAVQIRAYAAPRSPGLWERVRQEIAGEISSDGGLVDHQDGVFGSEIWANVPAQDEQGNAGMQPIRVVGVEGPRWLLQGVFLGEGANADTAANLEDIYRSITVVRGDAPMAPHTQLPIVIPQQVPADVEEIEEEEPEV